MKPLKKCIVLVTPRSFGKTAPELRMEIEQAVGEVRYNTTERPLTSLELREQMRDVDGLLAGLDEIDGAVFDDAPPLRIVARYGVGYSNVDLVAAEMHGVIVTNTPGANSEAVAELTIGFMFSLGRSIPQHSAEVQSGSWRATSGIEIAGRTLGLIGLGRIGRQVGKRAQALGCHVIAFDPYIDDSDGDLAGIELHSLQAILRDCDFLSLHLPLTKETENMVDERFLRQCRAGVFIINTARGELIDEQALTRALDDGRVAGAALDTLRHEPAEEGNRLVNHSQVIVTPHIGAHTAEATRAMGRSALEDLLAVLSGKPPKHPVTSQH